MRMEKIKEESKIKNMKVTRSERKREKDVD